MRDLVDTRPTVYWHRQRNSATGYGPVSSYPLVHRKIYKWRGDIVKSDGQRPTAYRAISYRATPFRGWESKSKGYWVQGILLNRDLYKAYGDWAAGYVLVGKELEPWASIAHIDSANEAETKLLADLASTSDVDIGQYMGELPSSVKMIAQSASTVLRAYRAARRGDVKRAAKILKVSKPKRIHKTAADNWLALQYGWLPLVTDTYNLVNSTVETLNRGKDGLHTWKREVKS